MKKTISILLSACIALTSCESFLDREPVAEVGSGDYFKDETSLLTYTNGFLQKYTPGVEDLGYGDGYSDIVATKQSFTFLTNASWTPDLQSGWSIGDWTPIYNINYFLVFIRSVGMPETFIFELTDLYNAKNIPKVIFCIHVLSHLLARLGRAERMNNLVGQFEFTGEYFAFPAMADIQMSSSLPLRRASKVLLCRIFNTLGRV